MEPGFDFPPGYEIFPCAYCGGEDFATIFLVKDKSRTASNVFRIAKCRNCSLVMLNPAPSGDTAFIYGEDYEPHKLALDDSGLKAVVRSQEPRRALVERLYPERGAVLDVGSGDGRFLMCMREAGWRASGCELVPRMAEFQKGKLGLDVRRGGLLQAGFDEKSFDVATLWAVFEHLRDPLDTLVEIRRILKPGGSAVFSMPNFDSLERMVFRDGWFPLLPPQHLFHYTPKTFKAFVDSSGLILERTIFSTTATGLIRSVRRTATGAPAERARVESGTDAGGKTNLSRALLFKTIITPTLKLFDLLHLGGSVNYVVRKRT